MSAKLRQLAAEGPGCLALETCLITLQAQAAAWNVIRQVSSLSTPVTVEMALEFKTAQVDLMFAFIMRKLKEPASRALTERAFADLVAVLDVEFRKPD